MVQTAEIERMKMQKPRKNEHLAHPAQAKNHHRSARARSWSLDSFSTITTADETRDISVQDRSVCSSVVWEGDTPVEINVPSFSSNNNLLGHSHHSRRHGSGSGHFCGDFFWEEPMLPSRGKPSHNTIVTQSTPIDLDLMDDYYKYERNGGNRDPSQTPPSTPSKMDLDEDDGMPPPPPRKAPGRNSSGGLEGLAQLPERFTRFEI